MPTDLHPSFTGAGNDPGMTDPLAAAVTRHLQRILAAPSSHEALSRDLLRLAANYRLELLRPRLRAALGDRVQGGLFAGLRLPTRAAEGCTLPKLLGCYEAGLQPHLSALIANPPEVVLNIGCAEGWYAVGLARLLPHAEVHAFDVDPAARTLCAETADLNGVTLRIGGRFDPSGFAAFAGRRVLVLCDVEGAERDLLDPATTHALRGFDLVVEAHDAVAVAPAAAPPRLSDTIAARFAASHAVTRVDLLTRTLALPPCCAEWPEIDQLLAVWEMRAAPTPWLVMRPRR
ncbi:MAG: hypothetical protein J0H67_04590 [Rhodospirillales bacterium]|nr:hypothetical protein [Rhodospirillales bacterium]MBN8898029.1 hypothetical protein [Rhodospirillales bacterium]